MQVQVIEWGMVIIYFIALFVFLNWMYFDSIRISRSAVKSNQQTKSENLNLC